MNETFRRAVLVVSAIVLAAVVWAGPALSARQAPAGVDGNDINSLIAQAESLSEQQRFVEAEQLFTKALALARQQGEDPTIFRVLMGAAETQFQRRQLVEARSLATEAVQLSERRDEQADIAQACRLLSLIERAAGNTVEARAQAQRALDLFRGLDDPANVVRALFRVEVLADSLAEQRKLLEEAAAVARASKNGALEGQAMHRLGDSLFSAEQYEDSLAALLKAASLFEEAGMDADVGTVHNSIGRVYRVHGRLDEALKHQQAALALHEKANDSYMLLQSLNAVAVVHQRMNDLPRAREYLQRALAIAEKMGAPSAQDFLRANMAVVLSDLGELAPAAVMIEQVLARGFDQYPSGRQAQLSHVYRRMGRHADALSAAEKSVASCGTAQDTCIAAYGARAWAFQAAGNLPAALADVTRTLDGIEGLRTNLVPSDFFKRDFHRYYRDAYSNAISLQAGQGDARRALETGELARSRAFLDLLASRGMPSPPNPAEELIWRGAPDRAASVPTATQASPANYDTLAATAARLGSTMVLYWVGDDATFVWVIPPSGPLHVHRVDVRIARLQALVRDTMPFADNPAGPAVASNTALVTRGASALSPRNASAAWRELYTLLVAPIRSRLPAKPGSLVTIVPDGPLASLSFAALQSTNGRYLLEDFTIHYSPAGAMFDFTGPLGRAATEKPRVLVVSDPAPPVLSKLDAPLPRLPGSRTEAAEIARLMPAGMITSLQDAGATETRVREAASDYGVLHFATHAVVRDDEPFRSYLALAPSGSEAASDGVLTAEDVYALRLRADLIVLSACRSAAGLVGDGISTFARAFLYAGTATFVASLWDVADEPTNRLLPSFYREWLGGASKAAALRRAQLALLADLRAGRVRVDTRLGPVVIPEHPVFWASFALYGEPD